MHKNPIVKKLHFCVCGLWVLVAESWACVFSGVCVYLSVQAPHGIPNISIPVDVFDVFEAT